MENRRLFFVVFPIKSFQLENGQGSVRSSSWMQVPIQAVMDTDNAPGCAIVAQAESRSVTRELTVSDLKRKLKQLGNQHKIFQQQNHIFTSWATHGESCFSPEKKNGVFFSSLMWRPAVPSHWSNDLFFSIWNHLAVNHLVATSIPRISYPQRLM